MKCKVRLLIAVVFLCLILNSAAAFAQLAEPPNDLGVRLGHIHMFVPATDIPAIQAWYDKNLGGLTGKRKTVATSGVTDCVYFHRFNVSFSRSDTKRDPTKGRALDHIGFEVKNLDELVKRL